MGRRGYEEGKMMMTRMVIYQQLEDSLLFRQVIDEYLKPTDDSHKETFRNILCRDYDNTTNIYGRKTTESYPTD